jgi:Sir2- and TIR-associating SLOG family
VRRLAGGHAPGHFMILKRDKPDTGRRQELWANDLKRVGIRVALIDHHDELLGILRRISRRSRGKSVFVTGSHETRGNALASEIGEELGGKDDIVLLDGQSQGIGRSALDAFGSKCLERKKDITERIRYFPNPYAFNPAFANDLTLLDTLKQWRAPLLRAAHTVVVFDGGIGTRAEVEVAQAMRCRIIPVPTSTRGLTRELLEDAAIRADLGSTYLAAIRKRSPSATAIIDCLGAGFE